MAEGREKQCKQCKARSGKWEVQSEEYGTSRFAIGLHFVLCTLHFPLLTLPFSSPTLLPLVDLGENFFDRFQRLIGLRLEAVRDAG